MTALSTLKVRLPEQVIEPQPPPPPPVNKRHNARRIAPAPPAPIRYPLCHPYPPTGSASTAPGGSKPTLHFIYGIRGRKKLVIDGHSFYKFSSAKLYQTWYCSHRKARKCRASSKLYLNGWCKVICGQHTHAAQPLQMPVYATNSVSDVYFDDGNEGSGCRE